MDQSDKKDDIGNTTPTDSDDNSNSPTGSNEHLWTPPEGQIPSRAQGQPPPLLFDQFMREAFAQLANNPGLHHHLPFTPGDLGGPSHGHGNSTGSNEHLLPPPSWGQMPQQYQQGPPNPMQYNPFFQQDLAQHLQQLINENENQNMRQQNSDNYQYLYRPPRDYYKFFRKPRNFTCSDCNHEGLSVVRLRLNANDIDLCWPIKCFLGQCMCFGFVFALIFIMIASYSCPQPSGICPLTITLGALLAVVTLFYCFYPCILPKFWDACHYCSNCNKCMATYSGADLEELKGCPCCDV